MNTARENRIQIINPGIDRGRPPRDLTKRDVISVPVDCCRGSWRIIDMLSNDSALALLKVYNRKNASA